MNRLEAVVMLRDEELRTIVGGEEDSGGSAPNPEYIQEFPTIDGWKG